MISTLLETNRSWLRQAAALVGSIDDTVYGTSPIGLEPHRAGGHLRHILEFYECFLDGCGRAYIDYDSRKRDARVETSRDAAQARIRDISARLELLQSLAYDRRVWVKAEASEGDGILGNVLASTIGRELQALSSHTVHHFALMAVALKGHGVTLPADFGVAPSTLRHQAKQTSAKAA